MLLGPNILNFAHTAEREPTKNCFTSQPNLVGGPTSETRVMIWQFSLSIQELPLFGLSWHVTIAAMSNGSDLTKRRIPRFGISLNGRDREVRVNRLIVDA